MGLEGCDRLVGRTNAIKERNLDGLRAKTLRDASDQRPERCRDLHLVSGREHRPRECRESPGRPRAHQNLLVIRVDRVLAAKLGLDGFDQRRHAPRITIGVQTSESLRSTGPRRARPRRARARCRPREAGRSRQSPRRDAPPSGLQKANRWRRASAWSRMPVRATRTWLRAQTRTGRNPNRPADQARVARIRSAYPSRNVGKRNV